MGIGYQAKGVHRQPSARTGHLNIIDMSQPTTNSIDTSHISGEEDSKREETHKKEKKKHKKEKKSKKKAKKEKKSKKAKKKRRMSSSSESSSDSEEEITVEKHPFNPVLQAFYDTLEG